ncbi:MAG: ABC transporter ATP-binding protein [Rhodospirillales bacterium]|nr:ABC transporter ATP-binding protein [Rhodospirillales bacterium]
MPTAAIVRRPNRPRRPESAGPAQELLGEGALLTQSPAIRSAADPAPAVDVKAARLAYRGELLFDDLDLALPAGRTTCLLGPSGVGKSSLLRLIAGLAEGARGHVGDTAGAAVQGRIAYMAQDDLLLPWATVLGNVMLGPRLRGEPADAQTRARAMELLARVGLAASAAARPDRLSGGMRQRAALARTLMEQRPIVLMDEPFSSLDAITRYELQNMAAGLLAGRTVLLVTHDPLEALRLGHRILVMAGRPARLDQALEPAGIPPRDPSDPDLLAHQAELLKHLARAHAGSAERGGAAP